MTKRLTVYEKHGDLPSIYRDDVVAIRVLGRSEWVERARGEVAALVGREVWIPLSEPHYLAGHSGMLVSYADGNVVIDFRGIGQRTVPWFHVAHAGSDKTVARQRGLHATARIAE